MRIMFVLKCQSALQPFRKTIIGKYLNMTYAKYELNKQNDVMKYINILWKKVLVLFASKDPEIKLLDPQKRLEDSFLEMSKNTSEQIKSIKSLFNNQVSDVETKLNNSQVRVEDGLNEMARNTTSYLDNLIEELNTNTKNLLNRIDSAEKKLDNSVSKLQARLLEEVNYQKFYFDEKLNKIETKLDGLINESFRKTNTNLDTFGLNLNNRFEELENIQIKSEEKIYARVAVAHETLEQDIKDLKVDSIEPIKFQLNQLNFDVRGVHEEVNLVKVQLGEVERQIALGGDKDSAKPKSPGDTIDQFYFQP